MSGGLRWLGWTALSAATMATLAREAFACPLCGDSPGPGGSAGTSGGEQLLVIAGLVVAGLLVMRGSRWLHTRRWQRIEKEAMDRSGKETEAG